MSDSLPPDAPHDAAAGKYRTTPVDSTSMPGGIPYIVGNEAAERFSFYGMRAILTVFMTKHLLDATGELAPMTESTAKTVYHGFVAAAYLLPIVGAFVSDRWLGKYRTIMILSIVYCLGHLALALDETRIGLFIGLSLIAVGAGGIKPCVSAHVGDQFGRRNQHLIEPVFGWYYFSINLGAFTSSLLTPLLLRWYGPSVAFGVPGALMLLATIVFWMGRNEFVHVPADGKRFMQELFSAEGRRTFLNLAMFFVFLPPFWALFDQTGSSWVLQAQQMNRHFIWHWEASQLQCINPILVLVFIPLFNYVVYPGINKFFPLTPLRKVSIGLFLTTLSFVISAIVQIWIEGGATPSIAWQILAYAVLTASEIFVSVTALEFAYTQAPKAMKSMVMAYLMLSISAGNLLTAGVNYLNEAEDGTTYLSGSTYYWVFTGIMLFTALLFIPVAQYYRGRTYIQGDET